MDDEVIVPSFDIEQDKPFEVVSEEKQQLSTEQLYQQEFKDDKFPAIRQHFEHLIAQYGDISVLAGLPSQDFEIVVKTKAAIVSELKDLLGFIDQLTKVDGDGR